MNIEAHAIILFAQAAPTHIVGSEPSLARLWIGAAVLTVLSFLLCRWRRRTIFVAFPLAMLPILIMATTLHDAYYVPEIRADLGPAYLVLAHAALVAPFAAMAAGIILRTTAVAKTQAAIERQ